MESNEIAVLTVAEVAEILKVGRNVSYELFNRTDFPSFRIGKNLRISRTDFQFWLENQPQK